MQLGSSFQQNMVIIQAIDTTASQRGTASRSYNSAACFAPFDGRLLWVMDTHAAVQVLLPGGQQLLTGTRKGQLQMWPVSQDSSNEPDGAEGCQVRSAIFGFRFRV